MDEVEEGMGNFEDCLVLESVAEIDVSAICQPYFLFLQILFELTRVAEIDVMLSAIA